jgi:hypothetical protein
MRSIIQRGLLSAVVLLGLAAPGAAGDFGIRAGYYTEIEDPFVGIEYLGRVQDRFFFNPNLEWVFVDDATYLTVNGDFHYDLLSSSRTYAWLGAGLGLIAYEPDGGDTETDLGVNLLGGVGTRAGGVVPYVQAKIVISDDTEFVIGVGLRF